MSDPIPLRAAKPSGTPPEVAHALRAAVEELIQKGITAGLVAAETADGGLFWIAVPSLACVVRGLVITLYEEIEGINE